MMQLLQTWERLMNEHGETYVGCIACFCDQIFGATREEALGKE